MSLKTPDKKQTKLSAFFKSTGKSPPAISDSPPALPSLPSSPPAAKLSPSPSETMVVQMQVDYGTATTGAALTLDRGLKRRGTHDDVVDNSAAHSAEAASDEHSSSRMQVAKEARGESSLDARKSDSARKKPKVVDSDSEDDQIDSNSHHNDNDNDNDNDDDLPKKKTHRTGHQRPATRKSGAPLSTPPKRKQEVSRGKRRVNSDDDSDGSFHAASGESEEDSDDDDADLDDLVSEHDSDDNEDGDDDDDDEDDDDDRGRKKRGKASKPKASKPRAQSASSPAVGKGSSQMSASPLSSPPPSNGRASSPSALLASFAAPSTPRASTSTSSSIALSPSSFRSPSGSGESGTPSRKLVALGSGSPREEEGRYKWLVDVMDKNKRRPTDPDYDPRTLYIPPSAWAKFTPFEQQYWKIKENLWDTIVFFKKGKFYEFYEKDAMTAHREFDLKISDRVNMFMAGVPESSFTMWASKFIALGYKVARVDEAESALGKSIREKTEKRGAGEKKEKIIRRELTSVLTRGTLMGDMLVDEMSSYILSIKEDPTTHSYGVCFADTGTAEFNLCGFTDDGALTTLETLLMQVRPKEIVCERGNLSTSTLRLIRNTSMASPSINTLVPGVEFLDARSTMDELLSSDYFADSSTSKPSSSAHAASQSQSLPGAIESMKGNALVMSALGGLVFYLRSCLIDKDLLSQKNFHIYDALRHGSCLLLDGQTLQNLDVLFNASGNGATFPVSLSASASASSGSSGGASKKPGKSGSSSAGSGGGGGGGSMSLSLSSIPNDGSLHALLNRCITPFGKRMFRRWLCHPLRNIPEINDRYDAIEDLMRMSDEMNLIVSTFRKVSDLERAVSRIHVGNCKFEDFLRVLDGFKQLQRMMESLPPQRPAMSVDGDAHIKSRRLKRCMTIGDGCFPDLSQLLKTMEESFDQKLAKEQGQLIPYPGVDPDYDAACETVQSLEQKLADHLSEVQRHLHDRTICYKDMGNEKYQLEVSVKTTGIPDSWELKSETKAVRRYWSPTIRKLVQPLAEAIETRQMVLRDGLARALARFDAHYPKWSAALRSVCELDCLVSLTIASTSLGDPFCRPQLVERGGNAQGSEPILLLEEMRHPLLAYMGTSYIPNDTVLGGSEHPRILLLTGPNMGGKSTLLRQTCLAVIMAQLGCMVPASRCVLSPVDRIFTRIGANDNILAGQSTFMVELRETSNILKHATRDSLVILDELGRGTSTFDGYSIAYAVLHHLARETMCRCLFSTHYHMLTDEIMDEQEEVGQQQPVVGLAHMACVVDEGKREVTFLYKLSEGVCNKSHGMNVASMAGVPSAVIDRAEEKAAEFEAMTRALHQKGKKHRSASMAVAAAKKAIGPGSSQRGAAAAAAAAPAVVEQELAGLENVDWSVDMDE